MIPKINQGWTITIGDKGWDGYCPSYFDNSYPFYGNKNQASYMVDVDIRDPNVLTQGAGTANLTNGSETGVVSTLITSILKTITSSDVSFVIGGDKLYKISSTTVASGGTPSWPYTITGTGAITGNDIVHYRGKLLYSYNDAGLSTGNIGSYDLSTTFDDDYWTTTCSGSALENAVHYMILGGDDCVYITNGRYIARLEGTTAAAAGLDFWQDSIVVSLTWNYDRVIAAVNRPNISGSNFNQSSIYQWNGINSTWDSNPVMVNGEIGALYTKNGVTFVWWKDATTTGGYNLGYLNGLQVTQLRTYSGSLPNQSQVGEYDGHLAWISSGALELWGAKDRGTVRMFPYMTSKLSTAGAFAAPFGTPLISSTDGAGAYCISKASGYSKNAAYHTIAYPVSGPTYKSQIDGIFVETEQMSSGAKCDITFSYDKAKSSLALTQIAYSAANKTRHKIYDGGLQVEDFRLDLSWANGSATNPCKIKKIMIFGHYIKDT